MSGSPFLFTDAEKELRREWWLNHACDFSALYGDDGEMQCGSCLRDFKREPLADLHVHVSERRLLRAREALNNAPVFFGLRAQGHVPTVERMLTEGATWDEIGKAIGWHGPTAQKFYEDLTTE